MPLIMASLGETLSPAPSYSSSAGSHSPYQLVGTLAGL